MARGGTLAAASICALGVLAGCGGGGGSSSDPTTVVTQATTAPVNPAIQGALLGVADVPGTAPAPAGRRLEVSACFPGNPAGALRNQNQVPGPTIGILQGRVQRSYTSRAVEAGPKQTAAYVATFASPAGAACVTGVIKAAISAQLGPKVDSTGLTSTVKTVPIADAGAVLSVKGSLKVNGQSVPAGSDLVVFSKGQVAVMVLASAVGGGTVPGQAVDLTRRIAGRLP